MTVPDDLTVFSPTLGRSLAALPQTDEEWAAIYEALAEFVENTQNMIAQSDEYRPESELLIAAQSVLERMDAFTASSAHECDECGRFIPLAHEDNPRPLTVDGQECCKHHEPACSLFDEEAI